MHIWFLAGYHTVTWTTTYIKQSSIQVKQTFKLMIFTWLQDSPDLNVWWSDYVLWMTACVGCQTYNYLTPPVLHTKSKRIIAK